MKSNYILIHGSFGSPFANWFPYLRKEIENRNLEVYSPDFPIGVKYQNYRNWEKLLKYYLELGILNENTIIFAHSIGPVFICKFLVENHIKIKRLVLVCGFNHYLGISDEYDIVNKSMFFNHLKEVKKYCHDIICFYTKNDPYVPYEVEKEFANTISNKQIVIENGGHLNSETGYTEFAELLKYL